MQCEECGKAGAKFYVDYSPQGDVVHQFDPDVWRLCAACAEGTTYERVQEYAGFLEDCLKDQELRRINSRWPDQDSALTALIRELLVEIKELIEMEEKGEEN